MGMENIDDVLKREKLKKFDADRAERLSRHQARMDKAREPFKEKYQPDDHVYDPRYGMKVSRWGKDIGAKKVEMHKEIADMGSHYEVANVATDSLSRMAKNGSLTQYQYEAGRMFQRMFDLVGTAKVKTTNYTGVGGGGQDMADHMARVQHAINHCQRIKRILGGSEGGKDSGPLWIAVEQILGFRCSLQDVTDKHDRNADFWNGVLQASLHLMAVEYIHETNARSRKRKVRVKSSV